MSVAFCLTGQVHPAAERPESEGIDVIWTSGTLGVDLNADPLRDATLVEEAAENEQRVAAVKEGNARADVTGIAKAKAKVM